jgi:hypothetical protein
MAAAIWIVTGSVALGTTQQDKKGDADGWPDIRSVTLLRPTSTSLSWTFKS